MLLLPAPPAPIGRCVMPNPFASPSVDDGVVIAPNPLLDPSDRAASFDPVDSCGLSISIMPPPSPPPPPALLLCRLCRFELEIAIVRGSVAAAPGPGVALGGAAAMGTTPLPAATEPLPPWKLVGLLPAVFAPPEAGESAALTLPARVVDGGVDAD